MLTQLYNSLNANSDKNAFFINGIYYSYAQLKEKVDNIRGIISINSKPNEKIIGLVANDDLETYASILALWFEGKAYVPLSPEAPVERNQIVIADAGIKTILSSNQDEPKTNHIYLNTRIVSVNSVSINKIIETPENIAYILFTSGTTGKPKGVPISIKNLNGFVLAFEKLGIDIKSNDRCLQMFELTFDLSVMSFLIPLLKGACIYTIPKGVIKFNYIFELLDEHKLTVSLMVPSIIQYLRPYFEEINCKDMRYSLFCGEALTESITAEWQNCIPNAKIFNVYGPTEDTIFCTSYTYKKGEKNKSHHGILSIGKNMEGTDTIIVDEYNQVVTDGEQGELCLGGIQLTEGYWNNPEKNNESFFLINTNNKTNRFYKTGDIAIKDKEGDIFYIGRIDSQVKVQGFRVELSEIEFHCNAYLQNVKAVAVAFQNKLGNTEIGLAIESQEMNTDVFFAYLKSKLPAYMIPTKTIFVSSFPLNVNGKTDRNKLKQQF